jgi:heme exporter protein A
VKPALTVSENLTFWAGLRGDGGDVAHALARLGLDRHAQVAGRFLSSGEQRRLALAQLAACRAKLWLLDEPAVGLDHAAQDILEGMIAAHRRAGGMVALSTHTEVALDAADCLDLAAFTVARPALEADDA